MPRPNANRSKSSLLALAGLEAALLSTPAGAECRIDEPRAQLERVSVSAAGSAFTLGLRAVPVQIRPDTGTDHARIQVLAPLRLTAEYPAAQLRYRVKRAIDLYGGRIRLGAGAVPSPLGVRGDAIEISIAESLQVSVKEPLRVPCSHLALRDETVPNAAPSALAPPAGLGAGTGTAPIALHALPIASNPIHVQYAGPYAIRSHRPGWVLLEAAWADGSRLRGWVRDEGLVAEPEAPGGSVEGVTGEALCGRSDAPRLTTFTVRKGAPIAAAPGGAPWAWASEKLSVEAFPLDRSDGWLQIAAVAGIASAPCSEHEHLWVHVRDLVWAQPG